MKRSFKLALSLLPGLLCVSTAQADFWNVDQSLPPSPAAHYSSGQDSCTVNQAAGFDLAAVVRVALCQNPATRITWLQAYAQADRVGIAKAAYLPTVDASLSASQSFGDGGNRESVSASINGSWLIYDFGGRASSVRASELTLQALQLSHDDSLQDVFKSAVDGYYQWFTADASLSAALEAEKAANETLRSAEVKFRAGTGTREDVLQAQTAAAQAALTVIQRQGERENALGSVAIVMGLPANTPITLVAPASANGASALPDWDVLLAKSYDTRPDLRAQKLRVEIAEANRDNTASNARPSISVSARDGISESDGSSNHSGSVGVNVSIPIFTGYRQTYQNRAAEKEIEIAQANFERLKQTASLELWQGWQSVRTAEATMKAADTVLASAQESLRAARARYSVGLGNLINVLNAQSALANAQQQQARARFDWYRARITLARASGELGWADLASAEGMTQ